MLVLSRRVHESIQLQLPNGEIITVYLNDISGKQAKIGIAAPDDVVIVREELLVEAEE